MIASLRAGVRHAVALLVLAVGSGCSAGSSGSNAEAGTGPECNGFGGFGLGDGSTACNLSYGHCSDGLTYGVNCPGATAACTCEVDGDASVATASAGLDLSICGLSGRSLVDALNRGCGWNLQ
jgi:hypothetical protein